MERERDEFDGQGGCYEIREGKRVRVTEPTKDHPEGNRPRDEHGRALDVAPEEPKAAPPAGTRGPRKLTSIETET